MTHSGLTVILWIGSDAAAAAAGPKNRQRASLLVLHHAYIPLHDYDSVLNNFTGFEF
jgi:hypothetical protein